MRVILTPSMLSRKQRGLPLVTAPKMVAHPTTFATLVTLREPSRSQFVTSVGLASPPAVRHSPSLRTAPVARSAPASLRSAARTRSARDYALFIPLQALFFRSTHNMLCLPSTQRKEVIRCLMVQQGDRWSSFGSCAS